MGIRGLWEILGEGRITPIARLASDHFHRTGRALRIAVDEAGWRFNNLTPTQVAHIRRSDPRANPVEKAILFRVLRLLKLNIRLLFVFDGPSRPWKRNRAGGGRVDFEQVAFLRKVLGALAVPMHRAPGEAEAECARLQGEGVVDAVWSEDGDALMFGAGLLIKDLRTAQGKSAGLVRVFDAEEIQRRCGLDRVGLVLFAVLSGGDYDTTGLKGCGPRLAWRLARNTELGTRLCCASQMDLPFWSTRLQSALREARSSAVVPAGFPLYRAVEHYRNPKVSSLDELHSLRGLKHGWDHEINLEKLRPFLTEHFNIWTRGFLKHVGPVLLVRQLLQNPTRHLGTISGENNPFGVTLLPRRGKVAEENQNEDESEVKITFKPTNVVSIDLTTQPSTETWSELKTKDGQPYDPTQPVECEVPAYILRHTLPDEVLQAAPVKRARSTKRKATEETEDAARPTKRVRSHTNTLPTADSTTSSQVPLLLPDKPIVLDLTSDAESQNGFENDSPRLLEDSSSSTAHASRTQLAKITAHMLSDLHPEHLPPEPDPAAEAFSRPNLKAYSHSTPSGIPIVDLTAC